MKALKKLFPLCEGEVIALTDANTYYKPDALRKLARHLSDPEVGVVTGDVRILPTKEQFGAGEGVYYKYERALQRMVENQLALRLLEGDFAEGDTVRVDARDGELVFERAEPVVAAA